MNSNRRIDLNAVWGVALLAGALGALGAVGTLSGCAPVVVGGAIAAGGIVATDPRTSGTQLEDQGIELRSATRIRDLASSGMDVGTVSYNRRVLMYGTVPQAGDRARVEEAVRGTPNVREVINEVTVGPAQSVGARSNDVYITSKVRASLLDINNLFANSIKVVTADGVVYLMGLLTRAQLDRATEIARSISGVKKVVRAAELVDAGATAVPPQSPAPVSSIDPAKPAAPASTGAVAMPVR